MKDIKVWYKDSLVILQSLLINIENENGIRKSNVVVDHYIFLDLKTRSFYEYKNFSDTAKFTKKYTQPDSVLIPSCWSFYKYNKTINEEIKSCYLIL